VTPLYPQKLALTSPTGGGRSVGMVRSRTKATEFSLVRQHNHFITQGNYKATCFDYRLVILRPILSIVSQDARPEDD